MTADQEKFIKMVLQAVQNCWESLRDYAWIIAGIAFIAITFLFMAIFIPLFRCGGTLFSCDFAGRRRLLESLSENPHD